MCLFWQDTGVKFSSNFLVNSADLKPVHDLCWAPLDALKSARLGLFSQRETLFALPSSTCTSTLAGLICQSQLIVNIFYIASGLYIHLVLWFQKVSMKYKSNLTHNNCKCVPLFCCCFYYPLEGRPVERHSGRQHTATWSGSPTCLRSEPKHLPGSGSGWTGTLGHSRWPWIRRKPDYHQAGQR